MTPSQAIIDTLRIPKNFDIDDLSISHDSDFTDPSEDNGQLTQILQGVIDDLIDEANHKDNLKKDDL